MHDPVTFERRLADAFSRYADLAPVDLDLSIADQAVAARKPSALSGLRLPVVPRRVVVWAMLGLLLLGAVATAVLVGSLLDRTERLPGLVTQLPSMDLSLDDGAAAVLNDGRVLMIDATKLATGALTFDPATSTFTRTAGSMHQLRSRATATTLENGLVLVAGGERAGGQDLVSTDTAELFDPATGTFTPTGSMSTSRTRHTATLLADGRVLVVGGWNAAGWVKLASAEIYDPATGRWSTVGSMTAPRDSFSATRLADGRVLVAGGWEGGGIGPDPTAEVFDPTTGTFTKTGSMHEPRGFHTATLLPDGRVLIVGGSSSAPTPRQAELYDPGSGTFEQTAPLGTEREQQSATLLLDGRVLIAGGANALGKPAEHGAVRSGHVVVPTGCGCERPPRARRTPAAGWPGADRWRATLRSSIRGERPRFRRYLLVAIVCSSRLDRWTLTHTAISRPGCPTGGSWSLAATRRAAGAMSPMRRLSRCSTRSPQPSAGTARCQHQSEDIDPSAIVGHAAVAADDRHVLFLGDTHVSWNLRVWDAVTGLITDHGPLVAGPTPTRPILARRLSDGTVVVVGPPVSGLAGDPVTVYRLGWPNPTLEPLGTLPRCGEAQDVVVLRDDRLAVLCGRAHAYALVTVFDPRSGAASDEELPVATGTGRIVGLADGRVLVASGRGTTRLKVLNPDTFATVDAGEVTTPEFGADVRPGTAEITMTLLADGRVLILGGTDASVWDPRTGSATGIPGPQAARRGHTATLLEDGRVLVTGGTTWPADRNEPIPPSAEIFDPNAIP